MVERASVSVAILLLVAAVAGCAAPDGGRDRASGVPPSVMPPPVPAPRAPGLTDLADGTVQAFGRLERVDLEGGFWAIVDGEGARQDSSQIVAVIANAQELERTLEELEGSVVIAIGTRFEGMSIRMAGPEIIVTSIREAGTVPGKPK